ncbi:hypothetical protein MLD38_007135 [Melastoma candidum]|uniref:Uncharacterized protein n=1 Tax=Melastoma candidum TaxID=119954 RepID=A0ACB9RRD7_9MYRT|nr:hypothetical protein MLD38_007135 [Melastoma candidum]
MVILFSVIVSTSSGSYNATLKERICSKSVYPRRSWYEPKPYECAVNWLLGFMVKHTSQAVGFDYYGNRSCGSSGETVYGHGSCNTMIQKDDCLNCMQTAYHVLFKVCKHSVGARVELGDCRISRTLIPQNETEKPGGHPASATFDLGFDGHGSRDPSFTPSVTTGVGVGVGLRSLAEDGIRLSELRTLYLLRQQNLGLSNLLGRSSSSSPGNEANNSSSYEGGGVRLPVDVRDALIEQVRINREIQDVFLSTHRVGNASAESGNSESFDLGGYYGMNRSKKVDPRFSDRKTIGWKP